MTQIANAGTALPFGTGAGIGDTQPGAGNARELQTDGFRNDAFFSLIASLLSPVFQMKPEGLAAVDPGKIPNGGAESVEAISGNGNSQTAVDLHLALTQLLNGGTGQNNTVSRSVQQGNPAISGRNTSQDPAVSAHASPDPEELPPTLQYLLADAAKHEIPGAFTTHGLIPAATDNQAVVAGIGRFQENGNAQQLNLPESGQPESSTVGIVRQGDTADIIPVIKTRLQADLQPLNNRVDIPVRAGAAGLPAAAAQLDTPHNDIVRGGDPGSTPGLTSGVASVVPLTPKVESKPPSKIPAKETLEASAAEKAPLSKIAAETARPVDPKQKSAQVIPDRKSVDILMAGNSFQTTAAKQESRATAGTAPDGLPAVDRSVIDQMVRNVTYQVKQSISSMKVVLQPESLGEVVLRVQVNDGGVNARFDVNTAQARTILETNLPHLRDELRSNGIDVRNIDVTTAQHESSHSSRDGSTARAHAGHRGSAADENPEDTADARSYGYNTLEILM
jgi:hypothetical protein